MARQLTVFGAQVKIVETSYPGGAPAIQLVDGEEPFYMLSCNVEAASLNDGEFALRSWSQNEQVVSAALHSGHFADTGRRVKTGGVVTPIWRWRSTNH